MFDLKSIQSVVMLGLEKKDALVSFTTCLQQWPSHFHETNPTAEKSAAVPAGQGSALSSNCFTQKPTRIMCTKFIYKLEIFLQLKNIKCMHIFHKQTDCSPSFLKKKLHSYICTYIYIYIFIYK